MYGLTCSAGHAGLIASMIVTGVSWPMAIAPGPARKYLGMVNETNCRYAAKEK
jgi:hypothetical protein